MKVQIAVAVSLALIASGCRYIDKLTGAPLRLDTAEAAVRYLDIVCPKNANMDKVESEKKSAARDYQAEKISASEFAKKWDSQASSSTAIILKASEAKTNPHFAWPTQVKSLVEEMSAAELEGVSAAREFLKAGGFTKLVAEREQFPDTYPWDESNNLAAMKASAIRSALRLPPRGEACKGGKAALTVEQMRKLQGS
jgi:hypothetical protein